MRIYNRFILSLAGAFFLTTLLLSLGRESRLDLYFSLYLIEYLALTLLFVYLSPRARRLLEMLGYILFPGFGLIVAIKVAEILWGIRF